MRLVLARLAVALAGLAIGLGVADLMVRSLLDVFACHERLGWTFEPGGSGWKISSSREYLVRVHFNSSGIRDDDRPMRKPAGEYRILFLGDSTVASMQVAREASYPVALERMFAAAGSSNPAEVPVEVINAGVDGYGTGQALLMYREHGRHLQPDLVVVGVFLGNDVADNWLGAGNWNHYLGGRCGRPYFQIEGEEVVQMNGGSPVKVVSTFLDRMLRLSTIYSSYVPKRPAGGEQPEFRQLEVFATPQLPSVERAFRLTMRLFSEFSAEVAKDGLRMVVLILPEKMQVGQASAVPDKIRPDYSHALGSLKVHLERESVPYIDLLPALKQHVDAGGSPTFYEVDTHLNEVGHQVVVKAIYSWLMEHCDEVAPNLPGC